MLALQSLHSGQIVSKLGRLQIVFLLLDPVLRLISVPVVSLHLVSTAQCLCLFLGYLFVWVGWVVCGVVVVVVKRKNRFKNEEKYDKKIIMKKNRKKVRKKT